MEVRIRKEPAASVQIECYLKQLHADIQDIPNAEVYMTDIVELILEYDSLIINCIKQDKLSWQERNGKLHLDFSEANEEVARLEAELASKATQAADFIFPPSQHNDEQKKKRHHFINRLFSRENAIKRIEESIPDISRLIPTSNIDIQTKKTEHLQTLSAQLKNSQPF